MRRFFYFISICLLILILIPTALYLGRERYLAPLLVEVLNKQVLHPAGLELSLDRIAGTLYRDIQLEGIRLASLTPSAEQGPLNQPSSGQPGEAGEYHISLDIDRLSFSFRLAALRAGLESFLAETAIIGSDGQATIVIPTSTVDKKQGFTGLPEGFTLPLMPALFEFNRLDILVASDDFQLKGAGFFISSAQEANQMTRLQLKGRGLRLSSPGRDDIIRKSQGTTQLHISDPFELLLFARDDQLHIEKMELSPLINLKQSSLIYQGPAAGWLSQLSGRLLDADFELFANLGKTYQLELALASLQLSHLNKSAQWLMLPVDIPRLDGQLSLELSSNMPSQYVEQDTQDKDFSISGLGASLSLKLDQARVADYQLDELAIEASVKQSLLQIEGFQIGLGENRLKTGRISARLAGREGKDIASTTEILSTLQAEQLQIDLNNPGQLARIALPFLANTSEESQAIISGLANSEGRKDVSLKLREGYLRDGSYGFKGLRLAFAENRIELDDFNATMPEGKAIEILNSLGIERFHINLANPKAFAELLPPKHDTGNTVQNHKTEQYHLAAKDTDKPASPRLPAKTASIVAESSPAPLWEKLLPTNEQASLLIDGSLYAGELKLDKLSLLLDSLQLELSDSRVGPWPNAADTKQENPALTTITTRTNKTQSERSDTPPAIKKLFDFIEALPLIPFSTTLLAQSDDLELLTQLANSFIASEQNTQPQTQTENLSQAPTIAGKAAISLTLNGNLKNFSGGLSLNASGLKQEDYQLARLLSDYELSFSFPRYRIAGESSIEALSFSDTLITRSGWRLEAEGCDRGYKVELSAEGQGLALQEKRLSELSVELSAKGDYLPTIKKHHGTTLIKAKADPEGELPFKRLQARLGLNEGVLHIETAELQEKNFNGELSGKIELNELQSEVARISAQLDRLQLNLAGEDIKLSKPGRLYWQESRLELKDIELSGLHSRLALDGYYRLATDKQEEAIALRCQLKTDDLAPFAGFLPGLRRIEGAVTLDLLLNGSLAQPSWQGKMQLDDAGFRLFEQTIAAAGINAELVFDQQQIEIQRLEGLLAGAPFSINGNIIPDPESPWSWQELMLALNIKGEDILLYRDLGVRVRADSELKLTGKVKSLLLSGRLRIKDGRYSRDIDFMRIFNESSAGTEGKSQLGIFSISEPPLSDMRFDIEISSDDIFVIRNNIFRGGFTPLLRLRGNGELPLVSGNIYLSPSRLSLPSGRVNIETGLIQLSETQPDRPVFNLNGRSRILGYEIDISLQGSPDQPVLGLRSNPPLANDELVLLLLTGRAPSDQGGSARQAGMNMAIYLGRDMLARLFGGDDMESDEQIMERFELSMGRAISKSGNETIEASFLLKDNFLERKNRLYITSERDIHDDFNLGLKIVFPR